MKNIVPTGRLTADPEKKEAGDQHIKLTKLRIANNDSDRENGEFYDVACWNKQAEFAGDYLKKGSKDLVQGSFNNESYKDAEGKKRTHFSINANRVEFC